MANKTIYDLTENQNLDADDLFEQDVLQNSERKSLKTTLRAIADKIITSLTFTGLNTTDKTIEGAINEVAQGGGGGGAGHTIKDDGGNALTQRSNLQFKGVYSHDDSTNSASVVEVAREMTWAEYQLLSASEKKGLITITDRFTADAMFVSGVFVDTDNVIKVATTIAVGDEVSYTATEDCFISYVLTGLSNTAAYVKIDGEVVIAFYTITIRNAIFVKKGQVVGFKTHTNAGSYTVYGIQQGTMTLPWTELTGTLTTGNTSLVISDSSITTDSVIDYYTDTFGVEPTDITVASGSITLTFEAQQSDIGVKVRVS